MITTKKYNNNKIRLWKGIGEKRKSPNIGISFHKTISEDEINQFYKAVEEILTLKYGRWIK